LIFLVEQDESKKSAEPKDLRNPLERIAFVVDSTPVLTCSLDREGNLRYYNKAFETAIECADHQLLGTRLSELVHGPEVESFSEIIEKCSKDANAAGNMTVSLRSVGGSEVICQLTISPVVERGGVVGVSVFGRRVQTENATMGSMRLSSQLMDELSLPLTRMERSSFTTRPWRMSFPVPAQKFSVPR
jgi:PAS domain S-box-containing protein